MFLKSVSVAGLFAKGKVLWYRRNELRREKSLERQLVEIKTIAVSLFYLKHLC